jgi:hypothetical protein
MAGEYSNDTRDVGEGGRVLVAASVHEEDHTQDMHCSR